MKVNDYVKLKTGNVFQILKMNESNVTKCQLIFNKTHTRFPIGHIFENKMGWDWTNTGKIISDNELKTLKLEKL